MKIAFVGASGYGNVGDDTYPLVFAQQLPEHELVIYNSDLPTALPDDLALLVLGGGGILYNNPKDGPADAESSHFRCHEVLHGCRHRAWHPVGHSFLRFSISNQPRD
jgi:hypothetical protein